MAINRLPRTVPSPEGKPVRPEAPDNQRLMETVALDPSSWTPELARLTAQIFDSLAETWAEERGDYRPAPLIDALARGGCPAVGRCLELGSGTGILTPYLQSVWEEFVCLDLSMQMLMRKHHGRQIQGDASSLPFEDGSFTVVVVGDGPLFAAEVARVLSEKGVVIWTNALGSGAPYFLKTSVLCDAFRLATPNTAWSVTESEASWGSWVVLHRD
jgi:SAM-dependent methyltransferase